MTEFFFNEERRKQAAVLSMAVERTAEGHTALTLCLQNGAVVTGPHVGY